jgi:phytoene synthase
MTLDALYRQAARATAAGTKSFYFASRFFPPPLARSAHAVYWFCRYTDDLVDECPTQEAGRRNLESWSAQLEASLAGAEPSHPVLRVFLDTVNRHSIPHEYPRDLIEGMRMDAANTRYPDFASLRLFCYRVASVVGLMMSHVIGFPAAQRDLVLARAASLGIAMQLTNILRDIGEDLNRGRIYLPSEDLARFGYTEADLGARTRNHAFRELMRFEAARARAFYNEANPGIALLAPQGRFAVRIASDVYREILHRIEVSDYDVFARRARVPAAHKYWITARHLASRAAALG